MARKKLRVRVHGYKRKGYTYRRGGKLIHVPATRVHRYTYLRKDIGALGRGRKIIPGLHPGLMAKAARQLGITNLSTMSKVQAVRLGDYLRRKYGQRRAFGMAHAQVVFRKRTPDGFKTRMKIVRAATRGKPGVWD